MTTLSSRTRNQMRYLLNLHRKQMQDLARLNAKIASSIAEEIEHTDISTPRRDEDDDAMREVEAGTFKRVNAARYGG